VTDAHKKLLGYLDITDGLRVAATKSNVTVEGFVKDAATARREDTVEQAARAMRLFRTDSAAVTDNQNHVQGGVLLSDIFPVIISRNELKGSVGSLMSEDVVTASPDDTIQKIYSMIVESGFSAFPVLKKGKILGLISRKDLIGPRSVRSAVVQNNGMTIERQMTKDVFTIDPEETVISAAELMVKRDVSRLPVVRDGRLVGILDRHDVLGGLA
jgi:CBS domain-containing protein